VWSLAAPLGVGAAAAALVALVASVTIVRLVSTNQPPGPPCRREELGLGALAVIVVSVQAAATSTTPDTALYHIQAIRWIQQYPAVPGLANLLDRLALAAPWFEAQALFDPALFGAPPALALNGLVFVVAVAYFLGGLRDLACHDDHGWRRGFVRLACVPAAFWLTRRWVTSASPDVAVALLSWVVLLMIVEKVASRHDETIDQAAWVITTLASFAAITRPLAAMLLVAPAWLIVRNFRRHRGRAWALAGLVLAVAAPFLVRNAIVSGYAVYPIPSTKVPGLSWAVPADRAEDLLRWTADWARLPVHPVPALDLAAWVPDWFGRLTPAERVLVGSLPVLTLVHAGLVLLPKRRAASPLTIGGALPLVVSLAGTLLWVVAVPDPRFAWGYLGFLAILLAVPLIEPAIRHLPGWAPALLVALVLVDQGCRVTSQQHVTVRAHWLRPAPFPVVAITKVAVGGIEIRIPLDGAPCWDTPLPCAPLVGGDLTARGRTLEAGWLSRSADR
jgi:hypothetical protein